MGDWTKTAADISFACTVLQGIAAALYIGKIYFDWRYAKKGGSMKPLNLANRIVGWLIVGTILTGAAGLIITFKRSTAARAPVSGDEPTLSTSFSSTIEDSLRPEIVAVDTTVATKQINFSSADGLKVFISYKNYSSSNVANVLGWTVLLPALIAANPDGDSKIPDVVWESIRKAHNNMPNDGQTVLPQKSLGFFGATGPLEQSAFIGLSNGTWKLYLVSIAMWSQNGEERHTIRCAWTKNVQSSESFSDLKWNSCSTHKQLDVIFAAGELDNRGASKPSKPRYGILIEDMKDSSFEHMDGRGSEAGVVFRHGEKLKVKDVTGR